MNTVKHQRWINARQLIETECDGRTIDFCDRIGRTPGQMGQALGPRPTKGIGDKIARLIEESFNLPNGWLDYAHPGGLSAEDEPYPFIDGPIPVRASDNVRRIQEPKVSIPRRRRPTPEGQRLGLLLADRGGPRKVPLISWVQAGQWSQAVDLFEPGVAEDWFWCPEGNPSENTYALKVKGDSMTAQSPTDRNYPHGSIIFVDPNKRVENGSRVVAKLPDQDEATFKIYKEDMGRKKLVPINTRVYDVIDITNMNVTICGVVIGSYMPE